ncbi:zf-HC2 domain-containing protein [Lentzea sp. BCCO 10_0798]|jgi:anti-sigma factor RsiW|uniref:Zf-HC2 domain-containing protein n=1 Tax=Lentzea kristufekii TaxID=3095430 RepID=A0ABU4U2S6_9PSEU|nr:zf-HC2 domain-containing protein [Lentzea sp. BCCO 10_0798]MDX8054628.1 zf-HC2 domain-containing protein [Lentzea sp. BCCO 10_0798]
MTDLRGWGLPEQHLLPDAVVAFVDGELSSTAHERASAHVQRCGFCAFETFTQQQARAAVRTASAPTASASLLDRLGAIPQEVELPSAPDGLAITEDGQFVAVQRTDKPAFGAGPVLGSSRPLGSNGWFSGRRARQGAGVVVSGMLLSALAFTTPESDAPAPAVPAPQNAGAVFATTP